MTNQAKEQGCGPQPGEEQPSHATPLERLSELAAQARAALAACERAATPHYWRLGQILMLARKQVPRGQWKTYLKSLGIEKTRASKARAIFRAIGSLEETAGLSVGEAYDRRMRSPRAKKHRSEGGHEIPDSNRSQVSLPQWVYTLMEDAERLRDETEFLSPTERVTLLPAIDRALSLLVELQAALKHGALLPVATLPDADSSCASAGDSDSPVGAPQSNLGR